MKDKIKKMHSFRFFDKDFNRWNKIAKKNRISLTTFIEKVLSKHGEDPHLFI